jgi:hypothetical protein
LQNVRLWQKELIETPDDKPRNSKKGVLHKTGAVPGRYRANLVEF